MSGINRLKTRNARLAPPRPDFVDQLYEHSFDDLSWLWQDGPQTPQRFTELLWQGVLCQFAVEDIRTGEQAGLLTAYNHNAFHGFAFVSFAVLPAHRRAVWPFEGALLFGHHLFSQFSLENLYGSTTEDHYAQYQSGAGKLFDELGRFPGRLLIGGQRKDLILTGMSRAQWAERGVPLLERAVRIGRDD